MANKVFWAAVLANVVFLITGCVELGYFIVVRNHRNGDPRNGKDATKFILYQEFPTAVGIANGALIIGSFFFTLAGFLSPVRGLLKAGAFFLTFVGLYTLCVGIYVWVLSLRLKESFFPLYAEQEPGVQDLVQTTFQCCGYYNHTSPAFITDETCPSPAAAALLRGCATAVSSYLNTYLDRVFTFIFGMVGIDALVVLAIVCLMKDRKERERYRHIDEKSGDRAF